MFDTHVTIIGNVLTAPEWRRTQSRALVANFKVASTARRLDKDTGRWVDGNSLRVRVNCWRKLAEGVASSVMVGDPVVVTGRLYTRDWVDESGNQRTLYELEAMAIGHDLSRGRSRFMRNRPTASTSSVEDDETQNRVHGEATQPVPAEEAPALPDERPFREDFEPADLDNTAFADPSPFGAATVDTAEPAATPVDAVAFDGTPAEAAGVDADAVAVPGVEAAADGHAGLEAAADGDAGVEAADGDARVEAAADGDAGVDAGPAGDGQRGRRGRGRVAVPV